MPTFHHLAVNRLPDLRRESAAGFEDEREGEVVGGEAAALQEGIGLEGVEVLVVVGEGSEEGVEEREGGVGVVAEDEGGVGRGGGEGGGEGEEGGGEDVAAVEAEGQEEGVGGEEIGEGGGTGEGGQDGLLPWAELGVREGGVEKGRHAWEHGHCICIPIHACMKMRLLGVPHV